jgi:hypothetical protein
MVPRKPEKRFPRDPVEGSEASGHGTAEGKHERGLGLSRSVNETAADSRVDETETGGGADHALSPTSNF